MKMIGMSVRSTTRCCKSRPLRSGSLTSRIKQLGAKDRGRDRKSLAEAKVSACQPALRTSESSDSRTETSSSTMNTIGLGAEDRSGHRSSVFVKLISVTSFGRGSLLLFIGDGREPKLV